MAGAGDDGDPAVAQVYDLPVLQRKERRLGPPLGEVDVEVVGVVALLALGNEGHIPAALLDAQADTAAGREAGHVLGVDVGVVKGARAADVVHMVVGVADHQRLVGERADEAVQVADADAGVDEHGLLIAYKKEARRAVELPDLVGGGGYLGVGECLCFHRVCLLCGAL